MYSPIRYCAWEEFLKEKISWFMNSSQCRELYRIDGADGVRVENFTGITTLQILAEIGKMMNEILCEPEQFTARIIFVSMYNDSVWGEKGNEELCIANSRTDVGRFLCLYQKRSGTELIRTNRMENGIASRRT